MVQADTGAIGGRLSHEFHVLADAGEDAIAFSTEGGYAANVELAEALPPPGPRPAPTETMREIETPGKRTIEEVSAFLGVPPERCAKTLLVEGAEGGLVALVLRGDHDLNAVKAEKLPEVTRPLRMASAEAVCETAGCAPGYVGPVGLEVPVIADHAAAHLADFVCGANRDGWHLTGVNWGRDLPEPRTADLRNVVEGDPSPDGKGTLRIVRGIEVGHIFQLGRKYSEAMGATVLDEEGREVVLTMGCYGIGVSRLVAAAIEQHHDERGICWPEAIAPFHVALIPIGAHRTPAVREAAEALHEALEAAGLEVLYDDRDVRPGVMFADADLVGIPHRVVVSERGLKAGTVEHRGRREREGRDLPREEIVDWLRARVKAALGG